MRKLDINYMAELEPYLDQFNRYRIKGDEFEACSPFRSEKSPSFAVNLESGAWVDFGADDDRYYKGHFTALLSFLRGETWQDTNIYLESVYGAPIDVDSVELSLQLQTDEITHYPRETASALLRPFMYRHPYLESRGITEVVQRAFKVGYDRENRAVALPWVDKDGNLVNIKFRSIQNKYFYYLEDGLPIKSHVYGLHAVHVKKCVEVWVVESEIDAMYLWSNGIPAVALGRAGMNQRQAQLIINSPIESLVIATDNDKAGRRVAEHIKNVLGGILALSEVVFPPNIKDVNDMSSEQLCKCQTKRDFYNFLGGN